MEKGYDTPTGENGNLLSGGERQRLSIARAILKNSPILLLDEATASLDIENELAVKQAIANLLKNKKTVVMIAHTLSASFGSFILYLSLSIEKNNLFSSGFSESVSVLVLLSVKSWKNSAVTDSLNVTENKLYNKINKMYNVIKVNNAGG